MRTVVGVYEDRDTAQEVVETLIDNGFTRDDISVVARGTEGEREIDVEREGEDVSEGAAAGAGVGAVLGGIGGLLVGLGTLVIPGLGFIVAAGPIVGLLTGALAGAVAGGLVGALIDWGIPEEEAELYAESVRRGGTLVVLRTEDARAQTAETLMERFDPIDVEQRAEMWREEGWEGWNPEAEPYTQEEIDEERVAYQDWREGREERDVTERAGTLRDEAEDIEMDVVEEDVRIGKREVQTGGVRVRSYVTEKPVEEDVQLRREHVEVEREPVDRAARDVDLEGAEDEVIELTESREEVVVEKQPRVVEEVRVRKTEDVETEHVRETARRRDVEVEQTGQQQMHAAEERGPIEKIGDEIQETVDEWTEEDWREHEPEFRQHYTTSYGTTNRDYNYYRPAYRYGYLLANEPRYRDWDWSRTEEEARRRWEETNGPDTWPDVRDAVYTSYRTYRGAV